MCLIRYFIEKAVKVVLCAGLAVIPAFVGDAQPKKVKKSKKVLIRENKAMMSSLDSLFQVLDRERAERRYSAGDMSGENNYPRMDSMLPDAHTQDVIDSMLSYWYVHCNAKQEVDELCNLDSVKLVSKVSDKDILKRLADMNAYITLPYNETVRNYIVLYAEKMPSKMATMLALADYYFPIFEETFNRYGMPEELKYMAVIESALNPVAVSRAGAKGMWQFMYTTAKYYGLRIDSFVDERLDPVKSADAAARYMYDSYRIFGDWNLAISSYNCGTGNVNKAIKRAGGTKDFWAIYQYLPRETRGYVPAFVGAMYAFKYYKEHGLAPADTISTPVHVDTFHVNRMLHFKQVSELTGIPIEELRGLNPQYVHDIIPGNEREYVLRIPYQYTGKFIENEDSVYTYKSKELFSPATLQNIAASGHSGSGQRITYKVKSGDYLGKIASRYHVTVNQLKNWNHLKSNNLRVGQVLVIYGRGGAPAASSAKSSSSGASSSTSKSSFGSSSAPAASAAPGTYTTYIVKSGDTLYKISKAYPGVSADDIMKFNGIGPDLRPGMTLKIPKK